MRKTGSNHRQSSIVAVEAKTAETKKDGSLDARLARIEAKLDALQGADSTVSRDQLFERDTSNKTVVEIPLNFEMTRAPSSVDWISPRSRDGPPVPPLTEALPIVESYFQDYNSLIPLFNQQSFMHLMNDYYKPHGERPRIYAGIINVVLAMGYRIQSTHHGDAYVGFNDVKIKTCIDNAQMMLDEFMIRDQDTLGLQALLGLVIICQASPDQTRSSVLIGAAKSKSVLSELSPHEARERANIFWDISLRTITPSSQIDSDIDIDLPSSASDDCGSVLYSLDGCSQFHLFRAKIQLAQLEGRIYDALLSNRSRKLSHEVRGQAISQIDRLMERWERSIPTPFRPENMTGNLLSGPLVHMTILYQTYLMCLTMTHGLYAHDSPWLKSLGGLGSDLLRTFNPRDVDGSTRSTPAVWEKCVITSREMLNILSYQLSACVYFSAMTFIFVNLIYHPTSKSAGSDQKLAELSMLQLQKYFDYKGLEKFKQLRHVLVQMESMAKSVVSAARSSEASVQPSYPFDSGFLPEPPLPSAFSTWGSGKTW
ncbi:hypothetical protein E0Z10_g5373 [Xylaria hypoxylon]|uniref:Xylanolytic transcriptional activator regulatory domain-containing protein n=1 Tax=Xylaria hypoxylon TaxID=37992 RepID=A0A4Z0YGD6_9PEZI|nr:hypothetical protein E0Z10_g5373 [Xylaria hypoxylon]